MTVKELFDHITKHMTAEQALMKLLEGSLLQYEKLKFDKSQNPIHPAILIPMCALDMGWQLAIEQGKPDEDVRGMVVGTAEYMETIFPSDKSK